jgi:hypothetical protein
MPRGVLMVAALLLAAPCASPQTSAAHPGSSAQPSSAHPSAAQTGYYYYTTPRSSLDARVHDLPPTDAARFTVLRKLFAQVNCTGKRLRTQPVSDKHHPGAQNLLCTWPSSSPDTLVVVAHYTRRGKGESALDDWSGAALLPALCLALQVQARRNTWIFLESAGEAGDAAFVKSLSRDQKKHVRAVVALDALGLDPTLRFFTPSNWNDFSQADIHLQIELLAASLIDPRIPRPQLTSPREWLAVDDTHRFRDDYIPDILLHSVPLGKAGWPGSKKDLPSAIDANAYYENYRTIAVFLVALDSDAARLNITGKECWGAQPNAHGQPNNLPCIH